jgi:hypothetical protein
MSVIHSNDPVACVPNVLYHLIGSLLRRRYLLPSAASKSMFCQHEMCCLIRIKLCKWSTCNTFLYLDLIAIIKPNPLPQSTLDCWNVARISRGLDISRNVTLGAPTLGEFLRVQSHDHECPARAAWKHSSLLQGRHCHKFNHITIDHLAPCKLYRHLTISCCVDKNS